MKLSGNERAIMKRPLRVSAFLAGFAAIAVFSASPLAAQTDPSLVPNTQPTADVVSSGGEVVVPTTQPAKLLTFNFKDASIDAVLDYLSDAAGFFVIKVQPVTGRVTMFSRTPVSPEEAVVYLNTALQSVGFTAI